LANTAIGMGTLSIPMAYSELGLIPGILITLFAAVTASVALHFLRRVGDHTKKYVFTQVAGHVFGKRGEFVMVFFLFTLMLAPLTGYIMVVGKFLHLSLLSLRRVF
jgi:amino acid permease